MSVDLKKRTEYFLKDLHARESMRLSWYRHLGFNEDRMQILREKKATHEAWLRDTLRRRGLSPAWYARFFYYIGHIFGFFCAILPDKLVRQVEKTLSFWIIIRYEDYFKKMMLDFNLRSMIEAIRMQKLSHNEPAPDVLALLEQIISEEKEILEMA